jgi:hypothetical protein
VVAIVGKSLRRSNNRANGDTLLFLVSTYATEQGLVLGQVAAVDKFNENLAILDLDGGFVTIDAMGCQKLIARRIRRHTGVCVLALTTNYSTLRDLVSHDFAATGDAAGYRTPGRDRGRLDGRRCWARDDPAVLNWLDSNRTWPGLTSIAAVVADRRIVGVTATENRYVLTSQPASQPADPARIAAAVRDYLASSTRC